MHRLLWISLISISFNCAVACAIFLAVFLDRPSATGATNYTVYVAGRPSKASTPVLAEADTPARKALAGNKHPVIGRVIGDIAGWASGVTGKATRYMASEWRPDRSSVAAFSPWRDGQGSSREPDVPHTYGNGSAGTASRDFSLTLGSDSLSFPASQDLAEAEGAGISPLDVADYTAGAAGAYGAQRGDVFSPAAGSEDTPSSSAPEYQVAAINAGAAPSGGPISSEGASGAAPASYAAAGGPLGETRPSADAVRVKASPAPYRGNLAQDYRPDRLLVPESSSMSMLILCMLGLSGGFFFRAWQSGVFGR